MTSATPVPGPSYRPESAVIDLSRRPRSLHRLPRMLYAFLEDGTLELLADADQARREYEGVDVEAGVVQFYDDEGRPLQPRFSVPNRRGRTLGLFPWVESGVFDLERATDPGIDSFELALAEAVCLAPNPWFDSLDALRTHLRTRGLVGPRP